MLKVVHTSSSKYLLRFSQIATIILKDLVSISKQGIWIGSSNSLSISRCSKLNLRISVQPGINNNELNIQGGPYVFERFLEAALRPWIDSDKKIVDKKIALVYTF